MYFNSSTSFPAPPNATSGRQHRRGPPKRLVIVQANSTKIHFSKSGSHHSQASSDALKHWGVTSINNASFDFTFEGTGVAVVGLNHSFIPVPDEFLPRWSCYVDGNLIKLRKQKFISPWSWLPNSGGHGNSDSNHGHSDNGHKDSDSSHGDKDNSHGDEDHEDDDIQSDLKTSICQTRNLTSSSHTLRVVVDTPAIPALFHSIRYEPLNNGLDLDNARLRIDWKDDNITYPKDSWYPEEKWGFLAPRGSTNLTIHFRGRSIKWFGWGDRDKVDVRLNGQLAKKEKDGSDDPLEVFKVDAGRDGNHELFVSTHADSPIMLDHFLVKIGDPRSVDVSSSANSNSTSTQPTGAVSSSTIAYSVIGGLLGLLLLLTVIFFLSKWIRRRRTHHIWKDSALPPAIGHPASRVSSRSSFSRSVVTGDIEYNPEVQKKMEALAITLPPSAIILHQDSGLRMLPPSEIPPRYTFV